MEKVKSLKTSRSTCIRGLNCIEVREYMLRAHGEPKTLRDFLENKKGLKDKMEKSFGLTEDGKILYLYSTEEASSS